MAELNEDGVFNLWGQVVLTAVQDYLYVPPTKKEYNKLSRYKKELVDRAMYEKGRSEVFLFKSDIPKLLGLDVKYLIDTYQRLKKKEEELKKCK